MNEKKFAQKKYWKKHSKYYLTKNDLGLGAVCYTGMPAWFNNFFDKYQKKCFYELVKKIQLKNKRILDVGCGIGRWVKIFSEQTKEIYAIDIESKRLKFAKKLLKNKNIRFFNMSTVKLNFKSNYFNVINSITVLQHIPFKSKYASLDEIARVCKKDGYVILIELIDEFDDAKHVFPLSYTEWILEMKKRGFVLEKSKGYEYILLLRLARYLQYNIKGYKQIKRFKGKVKLGFVEKVFLRILLILSYPLEEICQILPARYARHGGFLFKKIR